MTVGVYFSLGFTAMLTQFGSAYFLLVGVALNLRINRTTLSALPGSAHHFPVVRTSEVVSLFLLAGLPFLFGMYNRICALQDICKATG
jgi:formate hydrogenlyase subunit 3/multisubunit Na+/H+ antiporter MnhD subunit